MNMNVYLELGNDVMNTTEVKGYEYLKNKYPKSNVRFYRHKSPDFIVLPNNNSYEIKMKYHTTIYFHRKQYDKLKTMKNTEIMVFDKNKDDPVSIFRSTELLENKIIDNIKIMVTDNYKTVQITEDVHMLIAEKHIALRRKGQEKKFFEVAELLIRSGYEATKDEK